MPNGEERSAVQTDNPDVYKLQLPVSQMAHGDYLCQLSNQTVRDSICDNVGVEVHRYTVHVTHVQKLWKTK